MKIKPGDRVDCRIKSGIIINPYQADYDEVHTFEVLSKDSMGYYLYIPPYYTLMGSVAIDEPACDFLQIDKRFVGEQVVYVPENMIYVVKSMDGCICDKCREFYPMAEPNQENGSMICWSCRTYPSYK